MVDYLRVGALLQVIRGSQPINFHQAAMPLAICDTEIEVVLQRCSVVFTHRAEGNGAMFRESSIIKTTIATGCVDATRLAISGSSAQVAGAALF